MKYILTVRARPRPDDPVPAAHARVMAGVRRLPSPWGLKPGPRPAARDPGADYLSVVRMTGVFGPGVKGSLNYRNRAALTDEAQSDDWLQLEFDPARVDYAALVRVAFGRYVRATGAYVGRVADAGLVLRDFDRWQRSRIDDRAGVFRIHPVNYFDRLLCKRAFGLSPDEVVDRVANDVERASVVNDGALVVVTSEPLSSD